MFNTRLINHENVGAIYQAIVRESAGVGGEGLEGWEAWGGTHIVFKELTREEFSDLKKESEFRVWNTG